MRVLIAALHRNIVGGVEKYLQALVPQLLQRGHQVSIAHAYRGNPESEMIDPRDGSVQAWSFEEYGGEGVQRAVQQWAPDVVYSNGLEQEDSKDVFRHYPTVRFSHDYKGTCVSGQKLHSSPRATPCGRAFGAACLALYYPRRCGGLNPLTMLSLYRQQSALHNRLQRYDAVAVATRHMYQEMLNNGVPSERLHILHLPVVDGGPRPQIPARNSARENIVFVGRLTELKGVNFLLRAVPLAERMLSRPLTLRIAGDGPQLPKLQEDARALGVNAQFYGWTDRSKKTELMLESDLMAVPSLWPEPFGLVGIEAACLGVPSVAFEVGGISEWLISGKSGELAPGTPPTVEGLALAIFRALTDPQHYARLCRGALEVARGFTMERHIERLEAILTSVAGQKGPCSREYASI